MKVTIDADVLVGFFDGKVQMMTTGNSGFRFQMDPDRARLLGLLLIENAKLCDVAAQLPPSVKMESPLFNLNAEKNERP